MAFDSSQLACGFPAARQGQGAPECRLLVWERAGCWAAGLRAALGRDVRPVEIRYQEAAEEELRQAPASILLLEITVENVDRLIDWLAGLRGRWPQVVPVAAVDRGLSAWEPLFREAGVEAWVESPSQLAAIVRMVGRQFRHHPPPLPDLHFAWRDRLPW